MDHVVVDVEIQQTIEETPGGWGATDKLGVSCACLWEESAGRMRVYGDRPEELEALKDRLLRADRISGFNIWNFDFPVIWAVSKRDWTENKLPEVRRLRLRLMDKTDDILRRIWQSLNLNPDVFVPKNHGGWSLDVVAAATLGASKIGHGASAPVWYKEGQFGRLINYCCDDVMLERDLALFIARYGYVRNDQKPPGFLQITSLDP